MDPLQHPPSLTNMQDYPDSLNLSEVESLSDSDWLDIASNRESDDNDSVCSSRDTDHDELERRQLSDSRSRRSSTSFGSSRDGEVDAWEGFVEDSADEGTPDDVRVPVSPTLPHTADTSSTNSEFFERDPLEEQRVKEGLDQSMISTLSSSRSSSLHSSTIHTSSRDLRLSFPDPIKSSLDELANTSYEDIPSPSETTSSVADGDIAMALPQPVDPGSSLTPEVPALAEHIPDVSTPFITSDLNISLYGFSSANKWSMADKILEKLALGAGVTIALSLEDFDGSIRQFSVKEKAGRNMPFPNIITVVDRTRESVNDKEDLFTDQPSLAIVYMPCSPISLSTHTFYLPILVPSLSVLDSLGSEDTLRGSAQQMWDVLNIPQSKIFPIMEGTHSSVVEEEIINRLPPSQVCRAFERLLTRGKRTNKGLRELNHAPVITLLTIVSLVLGVVVSSTMPSSGPAMAPTPVPSTTYSASSSIWGLLRPAVNHSHTVIPPKTELTSAVISSSLKDFALSVFNPVPTSSNSKYCTGPITECGCGRPPSSWGERFKSSTDIILRPIPSGLTFDTSSNALSLIPQASQIARQSAASVPTLSSSSELSTASFSFGLGLTLPTSLSHAVNLYIPPLLAVVRDDVQDILDALDELMRVISHQANFMFSQTTALIQRSAIYAEKGSDGLKSAKETLYRRHERAQKRAREMKEKGAQWIVQHAGFAKGKAKEIAEGLGVDGWRSQWFGKEGFAHKEEVETDDWVSQWFGNGGYGQEEEVEEVESWGSHWFGKELNKRYADAESASCSTGGKKAKKINRGCRDGKLGRLSRMQKRNRKFARSIEQA
ncbi:hypothetical protein SERLA73DRAFT_182188 [Serpula lacrymans var. lacrymans S7.3]|uniref:Uncharacterized protein n=1 Tax=Serpula lacrymans var. lacrymans (strain S7.3) TaxID=936435 RepID=F8PWU3_SERL3|nr:hypothetical protein SERLA73DRAFT_182188 [Serpula lacrymans var. lacrymans S7.3]